MRLDKGQIEVVDDVTAEVLRNKTPAERIKIAFDMWESAHNFLKLYLKNTNPNWDEEMVKQETARRFLRGPV